MISKGSHLFLQSPVSLYRWKLISPMNGNIEAFFLLHHVILFHFFYNQSKDWEPDIRSDSSSPPGPFCLFWLFVLTDWTVRLILQQYQQSYILQAESSSLFFHSLTASEIWILSFYFEKAMDGENLGIPDNRT